MGYEDERAVLVERIAANKEWLSKSWHHGKDVRRGALENIVRDEHRLAALDACQTPRVKPSAMGTNLPLPLTLEEASLLARQDVVVAEAQCATGVDDPVRPKHYQGDLVMRIIEHFGLETDFYLANTIKYLLRHKEKAGLVDLRKALWYLQRAIERAEGKHKDGVR